MTIQDQAAAAADIPAQPPDTPRDAARWLTDHYGYRTVPIKGKSPAIAGEYWQARDDYDPDTWPDHIWHKASGVGVLTAGLVVIDIDDPTVTVPPAPRTFTVATARGRHIYWRDPNPEGTPSGPTPVPGVDRKADGGMVAGPGSIHPTTGERYRILDDTLPQPMPPDWQTAYLPADRPAESSLADHSRAERRKSDGLDAYNDAAQPLDYSPYAKPDHPSTVACMIPGHKPDTRGPGPGYRPELSIQHHQGRWIAKCFGQHGAYGGMNRAQYDAAVAGYDPRDHTEVGRHHQARLNSEVAWLANHRPHTNPHTEHHTNPHTEHHTNPHTEHHTNPHPHTIASHRVARDTEPDTGETVTAERLAAIDTDADGLWRPPFDATYGSGRLAHVRSYAVATGAAPLAVLGALLARLSAAVPPGVLIPGQPGVPAPLNVYTCLVGPSGHGKTTVMDAANRAVALPTHMAPHPAQPVSGEGLIAAFLEWQQTEHTDPDTGRTVRSAQNVLTRPNVYATYDEHEGLDRVRSRKENTLDSYARTAWSGRDLATTTADARRTRHVPAGRYSLGITTGATIDVAAALAADTDRGTAQRWLMLPAAANADTYPTSRPDTVPAPFNVAPIEAQPGERVIHVAAAVRDELWREHVRPKTADDRAHQNQMRLRLAALASWLTNTLDDRGLPHVTTEHWQWAGTLIDTHRQTLDALTAHQTRLTAAAAAAANAAAAHRAVTVDAAVTTRRADTLEDMIALDAARAARWLTAPAQIGTPQRINTAPLDSRRIRRANTAHGINTADYLAAAIEHALDTGWITTAADNRYSPGATPPPA